MTRADKAIDAAVGLGLGLAVRELSKVSAGSEIARGVVELLIMTTERLKLADKIRDGIKLGLAKLDPDDLAAVTEAARTVWRVRVTKRPAGE